MTRKQGGEPELIDLADGGCAAYLDAKMELSTPENAMFVRVLYADGRSVFGTVNKAVPNGQNTKASSLGSVRLCDEAGGDPGGDQEAGRGAVQLVGSGEGTALPVYENGMTGMRLGGAMLSGEERNVETKSLAVLIREQEDRIKREDTTYAVIAKADRILGLSNPEGINQYTKGGYTPKTDGSTSGGRDAAGRAKSPGNVPPEAKEARAADDELARTLFGGHPDLSDDDRLAISSVREGLVSGAQSASKGRHREAVSHYEVAEGKLNEAIKTMKGPSADRAKKALELIGHTVDMARKAAGTEASIKYGALAGQPPWLKKGDGAASKGETSAENQGDTGGEDSADSKDEKCASCDGSGGDCPEGCDCGCHDKKASEGSMGGADDLAYHALGHAGRLASRADAILARHAATMRLSKDQK